MKRNFIHFLLVILLATPALAQNKILPRKVELQTYQDSIVKFQELYAVQKSYPQKYELPYLIALSCFPELHDTPIDFAYKRLKTTMAARPKLNFIFKLAENREYLIAINKYAASQPAVAPGNVPFNGQIGLLAHELAHIADYETKSALAIIWDGVRYLFPGFKRKFEKATDHRTIRYGAGWQLYDFADFVMNRSKAPKYYKKYKRDYYMDPGEIIRVMKEAGYPGVNQIQESRDKPETQ